MGERLCVCVCVCVCVTGVQWYNGSHMPAHRHASTHVCTQRLHNSEFT